MSEMVKVIELVEAAGFTVVEIHQCTTAHENPADCEGGALEIAILEDDLLKEGQRLVAVLKTRGLNPVAAYAEDGGEQGGLHVVIPEIDLVGDYGPETNGWFLVIVENVHDGLLIAN